MVYIIIGTVLGLILLYVIFILLIAKTKIGFIFDAGERKAYTTLKKIDGKLIHNYMTLDEFHNSHQIDYLLINKAGVFVIEIKNYSGIITGNDEDKQWRQSLSYGRVINYLNNPVKQNRTHDYEIKRVLNNKNIPTYPVSIMVKNNVEYIDSDYTIGLNEVKDFFANAIDVLKDEDVDRIYNFLIEKRAKVSDREHVKNLKKNSKLVDHNICPRCHGKLVLRHGKYGDFYGCENYPKCKFKKKIDIK